MTLADDARVDLLLADFANADATGKLNLIGGRLQVLGRLPNGLTPPLTLVVLIALPARHYGEQFAYGISLHDEAGDVVSLPGPSGEPQALRIQQLAKAEKPNVPGVVLPPGFLPSQIQLVLNFSGGLLLSPGSYRWQAEIDGNARPEWRTEFVVPEPPPQPVIG